MTSSALRNLSYQSLIELSTADGINASGREEAFGAIFGRDSAITILKILRIHYKQPSLELLEIARKALLTLVKLQGKNINIESGEEPGKFIHEYRTEKFEHLANHEKPWYVYPEGVLKNYDSIDSTPLSLIALYKFYQVTDDRDFLQLVLPAVEAGLNWILTYADKDSDYLIEYDFPAIRTHGGLLIQSWTDSHESLLQANGQMPKYPLAPVEVQAYAWLAIKLWSNYFQKSNPKLADKLAERAIALKKSFNTHFIIENNGLFFAAQALDGDKNQIQTITGNPLLCLWAAYMEGENVESIIADKFIPSFVKRSFQKDLFDKLGGLRTMSTLSATFNPNEDSYHNGSFWPILNGMVAEGLENFGFYGEALKLKKATLGAIKFFKSPIELYSKKDGKFIEYRSPSGQVSCKTQAWSAAATLDFLT